jgi:hypothetical protein
MWEVLAATVSRSVLKVAAAGYSERLITSSHNTASYPRRQYKIELRLSKLISDKYDSYNRKFV